MKRMLINATQEEELRMAMVDGQRLYDLNIELPASERKKANIYKGQITRIEPSLEAAFVNYGADRHGFLPLKEISSEYFVTEVASGTKPNIREVLREGQDIVVQIDKEERGNKGAALTTYVSLAGRFIVLKPNKARSGGVSRRIVGDDRDLARKSLREIDVPNGMSVILRTAGIDRSAEELKWDIDNLLQVWEAIKKVVVERPSPFLIYRESNAVVRALRDYLTNEIGEILIDDEATYNEAREFVEQVMPHNLRKLKHYTDPVPLFTRYQIETQIESAFAHSVHLPSGGSLVIDHTEALVSIDINSARATKGGDIEATALNTNLEAADEIARQLRLRDLGGLVVIDFIDMGPQKNQRDVENRLREAVRQDRARVQLGKISRFGLLEMSRQRLRPSLGESSYLVCPRCSGIGNIRSVESLALAILRIIGEEARKERTAKVIAQLPVEVATYLLNEKRDWVQSLESRYDTQVILVANPALETPHYQVRRVRDDQVDLPENVGISYTLAESEDEPEITQAMQDKKPAEVAAITTVVQTTPAPPRREPEKKSGPGLFARIASFFSGSDETDEKKKSRKRADGKGGERKSDGRRRGGAQRGRKRGGDEQSQRPQERKGPQRKKKVAKKKKQSKKKAGGREGQKKDNKQEAGPAEKSDQRQAREDDTRQAGQESAKKRRTRGGRRRRRGPDESQETKGKTEQQEPKAAPDKAADVKAPPAEADPSHNRAETPRDDKPATAVDQRQPVPASNASAGADQKSASSRIPEETAAGAAPGPTAGSAPSPDQAPAVRKPEPAEEKAGQAAERQAQKPAESGAEKQAGQLAERQAQKPAESGAEKQADKPADKPAEKRAEKPADKPAEKSAEKSDDKPVEKPESKPPSRESGNGEKAADSGNGAGRDGESKRADSEKPAGRLLPWEPGEPAQPGSTEKD